MRRPTLSAIAILGSFLLLAPHVSAADAPDGPSRQLKGRFDKLGPFQWVDLHGKTWTDADVRGKVVIVQEWAAWCVPCVKEFPEVERLYEAARRTPGVVFVSLNLDHDPEAIQPFLDDFQKEYSFPVLFAGNDLKILSIPHTWIVDKDGYIREELGNVGDDLVHQATSLADAVKHRPPVSALPQDVIDKQRAQNAADAARSR